MRNRIKDKNEFEKKYYFKYPLFVYILYGFFCIGLLGLAFLNLFKRLEVGKLVSYYGELEITSIVVCLLAILFLTFLLLSNNYVITSKQFIHQRLFKKIYPCEKLLTIKKDTKSGMVVLYVEDEFKEDGVGFIVLSVSKKKIDSLIGDIRKINPHVSVEVINQK